MSESYRLGKYGEQIALDYLMEHGFSVIEQNYSNDIGEIDFIAQEHEYTCLIEVKTRLTDECGDPFEAVSRSKQSQIIRTAKMYMTEIDDEDLWWRFDVMAIDFVEEHIPHITYIRNAFQSDGA